MKSTFLLFISIVAIGFAVQANAAGTNPTKDVVIAVNDVFVPGGFDSKADSYVVVSGIFPNGCYKWKQANVRHVTRFEHEITSVAVVSQGMCIMVLIPFSKDVHLGQLESGTHTLRFLSSDGTFLEKTLQIQ